jgi:signal transduction histidine kinase
MSRDDLTAAAETLVQAGYFGFVWADANLVATGGAGPLAGAVAAGRDLRSSIPALVGLEGRIRDLMDDPASSLDIPNVTTRGPDGASQRVNYIIRWQEQRQQFLVVAARPIAVDETLIELQREARRRKIAEERVLEQAEAIQEANRALMQANEDLNAFTRIISHDLKAPMRAMRYFAEDLEAALMTDGNDSAREHLARLKSQSRRMSVMITSLLEYTRLDRDVGRASQIEMVDSGALVREIAQSLPRPADFAIAIDDDLPRLATQRALLDLILRNLIENAIKHHDRHDGTVTVSAAQIAEMTCFIIADDGPGIPVHLQEAVFNPFTTLAAPRDPDTDGSGMDLALVKRASELAGATLSVQSDPDNQRGTRFTLRWPNTTKAR